MHILRTDNYNELNIGPNGPIGSAFILAIGKFAIDPKIPVKTIILVRFLYYQEVKRYRTYQEVILQIGPNCLIGSSFILPIGQYR